MASTLTKTKVTAAGLAPYSGPWGSLQSGHLLRRSTFAPDLATLKEAAGLSMEACIDRLFSPGALPGPPLRINFSSPEVGIGETWIDLPLSSTDERADRNDRNQSIQAWWLESTVEIPFNIQEKMMLFWHNHFGMTFGSNHRELYTTLTRFRTQATGNFRQIIKDITIDPLMLRFLDGRQSTARRPNENFAREILELFTLGKGPQVGPGDYTNYTEEDVIELARAFTGWRIIQDDDVNNGLAFGEFFESRHDKGDKQLSSRLNNAVITDNGADEYKDVIDLIFQQDEVARHLCRKLYRFFVYSNIDQAVELEVITPMAELVVQNDYNIATALRALLSSEHFYQSTIIGAMIKTPLDFAQSVFNNAKFYQQELRSDGQQAARRAFIHVRDTGMNLISPPSVAGYEAYYQEPSFHHLWLNTSTIQERTNFVRSSTLRWFIWNRTRFYVDWLALAQLLNNPLDPVSLINEFAGLLFPRPLDPAQITALVELLLDGQEDFVWRGEYSAFQADPFNEEKREIVDDRLRQMLFGMMQLAEFHLT